MLPKYDDANIVCHKDNDRINNHVNNLYWSTQEERTRRMYDEGMNKNIRPVLQYTLDGEFVARHPSLRQANIAMGKSPMTTSILNVCKERYNTTYGFKWKYEI